MSVIGIDTQTVKFQHPQLAGKIFIISNNQATFRTGNIFDGVKRKNSGTFCANMSPFVIRTYGMGSIFDNCDAVTFANGANGVNICWRTGIMHRNDGFSAWCNGCFDRFRRDHQRIAVDIHHYRRCTQQGNHIEG